MVASGWHHLAEERIEDVRPQIPMDKRFWPVTQAEKKEIGRIFKLPEVCDLITSLKERDKGDEVEVVDAAYWMKGCSSLGRLRFAVLLGIGEKKKNSEGFCLIDIKEAVPVAAPHFAKRRCRGTMQSASSKARENYRLFSENACCRDTLRVRQPSCANCSRKTSSSKWTSSRAMSPPRLGWRAPPRPQDGFTKPKFAGKYMPKGYRSAAK